VTRRDGCSTFFSKPQELKGQAEDREMNSKRAPPEQLSSGAPGAFLTEQQGSWLCTVGPFPPYGHLDLAKVKKLAIPCPMTPSHCVSCTHRGLTAHCLESSDSHPLSSPWLTVSLSLCNTF
jgi:hypothetical protein